jgi:hypothetical protein
MPFATGKRDSSSTLPSRSSSPPRPDLHLAGMASGGLLEVSELDLERDCAAATTRAVTVLPHFVGDVLPHDGVRRPDAAIFLAHSTRPKAVCWTLFAAVRPASARDIARRQAKFWAFVLQLCGSGGGLRTAPAELAAISPHAVQDHRELAGDRDRRAA